MPVKLKGSTSGDITLDTPAVAGSNVLTLPAATDTLVGKATTDTLTNKTLSSAIINSPVLGGTITGTPTTNCSLLRISTAQNTTSGSSVEFTDVPSWCRSVTLMFSQVSQTTAQTSNLVIILGTASAYETTGYFSTASGISTGANTVTSTTAFVLDNGGNAAYLRSGIVFLANPSSNIWVSNGSLTSGSGVALLASSGYKSLSGPLTRIKVQFANGTDTFDGGLVNAIYQ